MRALREHGQTAKYVHAREGYTARLDTIQAIVLGAQAAAARRLERASGGAAARYYAEALRGVGDLRLPPVPPGSDPVWHLYVVRTADPERLGDLPPRARHRRPAATTREPVHLTEAYAGSATGAGEFPVAEALARECLSLPIFPGITEAAARRRR